MPKPLYIPTNEQKLAGQARRLRRLERRGSGPWHYVGGTNYDGTPEPAFQNGWTNAGAGKVDLRYRWNLGGGTDLQGSITGGDLGTVAFTLPAGYFDPTGEVRVNASDENGNLVVLRIQATGDVVVGLV